MLLSNLVPAIIYVFGLGPEPMQRPVEVERIYCDRTLKASFKNDVGVTRVIRIVAKCDGKQLTIQGR